MSKTISVHDIPAGSTPMGPFGGALPDSAIDTAGYLKIFTEATRNAASLPIATDHGVLVNIPGAGPQRLRGQALLIAHMKNFGRALAGESEAIAAKLEGRALMIWRMKNGGAQ